MNIKVSIIDAIIPTKFANMIKKNLMVLKTMIIDIEVLINIDTNELNCQQNCYFN